MPMERHGQQPLAIRADLWDALHDLETFHEECSAEGYTDSMEAWELLERLYQSLTGRPLPEIPDTDDGEG